MSGLQQNVLLKTMLSSHPKLKINNTQMKIRIGFCLLFLLQ